MTNQLTKQSTDEQLQTYFENVLMLSKSGSEFPINLDDVWRVVYERKDNAVKALTESPEFIEGIDYCLLRKNAEQKSEGRGGHNKVDYMLSLPCLEFFIARKVRAVFEVYRKVFHNTAYAAELIGASTPKEVLDVMSNPTQLAKATIKRKPSLSKTRAEGFHAYMDGVKKMFSLDDVSMQRMYNKFATDNDLPLIDYVQSENGNRDSLTNLLKKYGSSLTTRQANKRLEELGILELRSRTKGNGKVAKFYVVTEKGKAYGDNFQSEHSPKQTQPLWYENQFTNLLNLM